MHYPELDLVVGQTVSWHGHEAEVMSFDGPEDITLTITDSEEPETIFTDADELADQNPDIIMDDLYDDAELDDNEEDEEDSW